MNGYDKLADNQLAAAAQQGGALAEGALVKRYADVAEGISRSYFLVGGYTDDVRQIALIALLEAVRSFDPSRGAEFKTYASTCIRNRLLDAVRSAGANKNSALNNSVSLDDETEDGGVAPGALVEPELSPEQQYIAREAEEAFFEALREVLGEQDLSVIKLYLACVPYKEISKKLGISAKKVDNTVYNAKKKIARIIAGLGRQ